MLSFATFPSPKYFLFHSVCTRHSITPSGAIRNALKPNKSFLIWIVKSKRIHTNSRTGFTKSIWAAAYTVANQECYSAFYKHFAPFLNRIGRASIAFIWQKTSNHIEFMQNTIIKQMKNMTIARQSLLIQKKSSSISSKMSIALRSQLHKTKKKNTSIDCEIDIE